MLTRFSFLILFAALIAAPARADDAYARPTPDNLARTLVRFSAIDIKDDTLLDEYAMITDCGLAEKFYGDDFKWNQVRTAMRESIHMNIGTFPTSYAYTTKLQLDRYDFNEKLYRFTAKTGVRNVNAFTLYSADEIVCGAHRVKYLPFYYRAVLDTPVSIAGLPLSVPDAKTLLGRMSEAKNTDRIVYARFNLRIVYIEPLRRVSDDQGAGYVQHGSLIHGHEIRLDARLDSVDFYEDAAMTKLIYEYRL